VNYEVSEKGGEVVRVGLREVGEGQYQVTIDGHTDGLQFEAMVDEKGAHGFDVLIAGRLYHLESLDERTKLLASHGTPAVSGPQEIRAEMPGKVVKVAASVGDEVDAGQGVVVIEAMKMENEIPSPIAGVVTAIAAAEGDTVESGDALFTVEPPSSGEG
jgi:biotin carboxyl carrier protein